jgi:hypothetical protein
MLRYVYTYEETQVEKVTAEGRLQQSCPRPRKILDRENGMRSNIHFCFQPNMIDLPKLVIFTNMSGRVPLKKFLLKSKISGEFMDSGALVSQILLLLPVERFQVKQTYPNYLVHRTMSEMARQTGCLPYSKPLKEKKHKNR